MVPPKSFTKTAVGHYILLMLGVWACSSAVIFIKLGEEHPMLVASYRCVIAAMLLLPVFLGELKKHRKTVSLPGVLKRTVIPGILLSIHFITWIKGARMTTTTNSTLIVNMVPLAMPFFLFFMTREKVSLMEMLGTLVTVAGVVILTAADLRFDREFFMGDLLCLASMVLLAGYMAFGRKNRDLPSIWLYTVPLYLFSGLVSLGIACLFVNPVKAYAPKEILLLAALAVVPTIFGHTVLNYSMKFIRGQIVSLANLGQIIFAGLMAFVFWKEVPRPAFYIASVLLIIGFTLALQGRKS